MGFSISASTMCSTDTYSSFMCSACFSASLSAASTLWEMYTFSGSRPGPDTLGMRSISRSQAESTRCGSMFSAVNSCGISPSCCAVSA